MPTCFHAVYSEGGKKNGKLSKAGSSSCRSSIKNRILIIVGEHY